MVGGGGGGGGGDDDDDDGDDDDGPYLDGLMYMRRRHESAILMVEREASRAMLLLSAPLSEKQGEDYRGGLLHLKQHIFGGEAVFFGVCVKIFKAASRSSFVLLSLVVLGLVLLSLDSFFLVE